MPRPLTTIPILLAASLAGCAGGAAPPPAEGPVRVLGVSVDSLPAEPAEAVPAAAPEPSLQERRAAPFAVQSSGRAAAHREERVVVLRPPAAEPEAPPASASPAPASGTEPAAATRPAAPPAAPAPVEEGVRVHRVEWGETWYGIARRYGVSTAALARANPEVEPERLRSGTELRIPQPQPSPGAARTHTVRAGDTLWGIAQRYGVSMERIRAANRLPDDRVRLGQTLIIPAAEEGR